MKRIFFLFLCLQLSAGISAQKTDKKLQRKVEDLVSGFHGDIGVYIKDLKKGREVSIGADSLFSTASIVKVPIMIGVMDKIAKGELSYTQPLRYRDSLLYAGADILGSFRDSQTIELGKLMMLMLTMSDNTASLWLQSLAGGGTRINAILDSIGFEKTRINSRTPGREANRLALGWGQTTPREMALLFERIYNGTVISRGACDKMLRLLNRSFFDNVSLSQLPPTATVFSKYGALNENRNEVVMVVGPKSRFVFSVFTRNNKDLSWKKENEAWELTRKLARLLWHYYEPGSEWKEASDAALFEK